jgi:hypothetical protein
MPKKSKSSDEGALVFVYGGVLKQKMVKFVALESGDGLEQEHEKLKPTYGEFCTMKGVLCEDPSSYLEQERLLLARRFKAYASSATALT